MRPAHHHTRQRFALVPLLLLTAQACAAGRVGAPVGSPPTPVPTAAASTIPLTTPEAIARARADSTRYPWTPADAAFMTGMIGHHAQAIQIARWAPTHGANPEIQRLAARIINAQQDEITLMRRWLASRELPVPAPDYVDPRQDPHAGHGAQDHAAMTGMLTAAQLTELDAARGGAFDQLFLRFMIQHHRGAVTMVQDLLATDGAAQDELVFKFSNDVQVDQRTEVARMERMLVTLLIGSPR